MLRYLISLLCFGLVSCSFGDETNEYLGCYHVCHFNNCTSVKSNYLVSQGYFENALGWTCDDECRYNCMWHTVEVFRRRKHPVPQFHGKWPFIRMLGCQEPASVIFSVLNLVAHVLNLSTFRKKVPSNAPFYFIWHIYSLICINAWVWSIIFHARDTNFTEAMDYFSAFAMVLFSLLALALRTSGKNRPTSSTLFIVISFFGFYAYHIWYLSVRSFDYGYNMKVNIFVGLINGFGWLMWCYTRKDNRLHLKWCQITIIGLAGSMLLELLDFAPLLWTFDAHSLWHLSTFPLPYYWYRFLAGDCLYMMEIKDKMRKSV